MAIKLNSAEDYEPIDIILSRDSNPIAYQNKLEELVEQELFPTIEEAERFYPSITIECEIYYHKHCGLFAVESGAVEAGTIYSPYDGELCEEYQE
jgi:hypothetical protein